jgi:hypothetical protein
MGYGFQIFHKTKKRKNKRNKMKRIVLTIMIILVFALSACQSTATTNTAGSSQSVQSGTTVETTAVETQTAAGALNTSYTNAVPVEYQLIVGTFKLEGTSLAVTDSQAKVLLPLWNNLITASQSMGPGQPGGSQSNTAQNTTVSQDQLTALIGQIEAAMTPEQIKAIADMQITQDTAQTVLSQQGITLGAPQQNSGTQNNGNGQAAQGAAPSGNQPSTQGNAPANGQQPPQGTPPAGNGNGGTLQKPGNGAGMMLPPEVTNALVQLLEKRSGATVTTGTTNGSSLANPGAAPSSSTTTSNPTGVYTLDGSSATQDSQTYAATKTDESAVLVSNGGNLTLSNSTITSSGDSSSTDNSSFYGLNAGILAQSGSKITLSNIKVTTSGSGANGIFASGTGSSITMFKVTIHATGEAGHGVMATQGGSLTLTDVDISTTGTHSGAIATDRGGGTITVAGGTVITSGQDSPGIYSTGNITVSGGKISATGSEAAVIEGGNTITLNDTNLSSTKEGKWGVMIYQSMSGDAEGTKGTFTMTGGSLDYTSTIGPLFYVTNSTGVITLKDVNVTVTSGVLVKASAGNWGSSGSNGGTVILTADGETLSGNMLADAISTISVTLQNNSSLSGSINADKNAKAANLTLDATSTWTVTADSYLSCLTETGGISGTTIANITGNGHTVYYDKNACTALGGNTYNLSGGGTLKPAN